MNCFVITLKSDKPRYNRVLKIQKTSNFDIKIMDAIDGKTISKNFLNFLLQNNAINKQIIKKFTKGTIGCYLSHMKTWTNIRKHNFNHTIILEDDFKLANNFQEKINLVIEELPEDYDICYFFYHPYSKKYYKNFNKFEIYGKKYIRRQVPTWGLVGYMVSLEGAKKLIDKCHTMTGHIDNQISRLILLGQFNAFHSKEQLVDTVGSCLYKNPNDIIFDSNTNKGGFFKF